MVDFYLQPMKRPFTGRKREWPFVVRATPMSSPVAGAGMDGQVIVTPQLPWWLALLLLVSGLALCGLGVWLLISLPVISNLLSSLGS